MINVSKENKANIARLNTKISELDETTQDLIDAVFALKKEAEEDRKKLDKLWLHYESPALAQVDRVQNIKG